VDDRSTELRVDWRIATGVAAALVLLFTIQNYLAPAAARAGASLERFFQLQIIVWGSWLLLSPWIFAVARRWRRSGTYTPLAFAKQVLIAFVISIAASALSGVLRWLAGISVYTELPDVVVSSVIAMFGSSVLRYSLIAAAYHAVAYHREVRERDVRAARLESALLKAKLESLQGRLHPHFLFNTLNSILALIRDQPAAAERMLGSLADLLRASLHADPSAEVPLEQELDLVRQYVSIQQMRFTDRLNVSYDVAPEAQHALVPHLLLQPLVENAIRHGIAPREAPGHVRIAAGRQDDRLRLVVEDDGVGMGEGRAETAGSGFGLQGTRARLEQLYGAAAHVDLQHRTPSGVTATVDLPFHT
jgi:signal transduction histidine kinase